MKILDPVVKSSFESQGYKAALLISMNVAGVDLHFTDWDHKLYDNGIGFSPRGMDIRNINYGATNIVSSLSMRLDDVDRALYETFGELGIDKYKVSVAIAVLDDLDAIQGTLVVFSGFVSQWEYQPGSLSVKVSSIFEQWGRVTTSRFSGSCRWKVFKGNECNYVGTVTECTRTYSECLLYGNEDNFGGFRWLPGMVNKSITT